MSWAKLAAGLVTLLNGLRTAWERWQRDRLVKEAVKGRAAQRALERLERAKEAERELADPDSNISRRVRDLYRD